MQLEQRKKIKEESMEGPSSNDKLLEFAKSVKTKWESLSTLNNIRYSTLNNEMPRKRQGAGSDQTGSFNKGEKTRKAEQDWN